MVEVFKGMPIRRMTTGGNYVNLTADVVLLSDYEALRDELEQVKRENERLTPLAVAYDYLEAPEAEACARNAAHAGDLHPDDLAVDRFAVAMKAKLARKRAEGRGGWHNPQECSAEHLSYLLIQHCLKGDPLDVGNLAMMLHQRGDRIVIDDETASIMRRTEPAGEATPVEQLVSDAMVEAFQSKYQEFWKGSWPDRGTTIELIEAALGARGEQ
jgi:hypothetical protein